MTGDVVAEIPLAALLRAARTAVGRAIRSALEDAGYDDMPANGPYVISAASVGEVPLAVVIERLGLSKQAAGHLVDLLVLRGYLERQVDPQDRRRLVVLPTDRGAAAAFVIGQVAHLLEVRVAAELGDADLLATRRTLAWLARSATVDA